ncbi:hypothetical protein ACSBR2_006377 [Camellia fascicularis]
MPRYHHQTPSGSFHHLHNHLPSTDAATAKTIKETLTDQTSTQIPYYRGHGYILLPSDFRQTIAGDSSECSTLSESRQSIAGKSPEYRRKFTGVLRTLMEVAGMFRTFTGR